MEEVEQGVAPSGPGSQAAPGAADVSPPAVSIPNATRKIVINAAHGGFSLSRAAFLRLRELGHPDALSEPDIGEKWDDGSEPRRDGNWEAFCRDIKRDDPSLIEVINELGRAASGTFARLVIVEIPADVRWQIEEYEGLEWIAEEHRTWNA